MRPNCGWDIKKIEPHSFRKSGKSFSVLGKLLLKFRKIHPQKNWIPAKSLFPTVCPDNCSPQGGDGGRLYQSEEGIQEGLGE